MKNTLLICILSLLQITSFSQNICDEAICVSDAETYNGLLSRTNLDFQACDNSYISYEAVHVFTSFESGTATISFLETHFAGYDLMILDNCDLASSNCIFIDYSEPNLPNGVDFTVESNTTYYIIISETVSGAGGTLEYTLQLDLPGQNTECTNLCSTAIPLEDGVQYLGILEENNLNFDACGSNYNSYAVVHTFESLENESVTISFTENWFGAFDLILLEGCDQNNLNCVYSSFAGQEVTDGISIDIDSNTSYYILIAEVATGGSGELDYNIRIDFDGISSNKDLNYSQVNVFPNPAPEVLFISSQEEIKEMQCIDRTGRVVTSPIKNLNRLDISFLRKGIYTLKVKFKSGEISYKRFVKL